VGSVSQNIKAESGGGKEENGFGLSCFYPFDCGVLPDFS
jgi:hypothetical protein